MRFVRSVPVTAALPLPFVGFLVTRLRSNDPVWGPQARIGRAFRAGVAARRRLDGIFCEVASATIPFRNSYCVCLRGPGGQPGFWTGNYSTYIERVGSQSGFHEDSSSLPFPTQVEIEAYLVGTRRPWPQRVQ